MKNILKFFAVVSILFLVSGLMLGYEKKEEVYKDPHTVRIEKEFSGWNGSHVGLTKMIKSRMDNPDSYEHVKTKYWDEGDYITVGQEFRRENTYGAIVIGYVMAKISFDGEILEILKNI